MTLGYVYFGNFGNNYNRTKNGQTATPYERICNYNTSHPDTDFNIYILIEINIINMDYLEEVCLLHFDDVKARHSTTYTHRNNDNEWLTIRPSRDEIILMLSQRNIPFEYRVLSDAEIKIKMNEIKERERQDNEKKQIVRDKLRKQILQKEYKRIKEPLAIQIPILQTLETYFKINDIGHIIEPCGLGKSFLAIHHCKTQEYKTILIGVPSVFLQGQMRDEINEVVPDAKILFIGGDNDANMGTVANEMTHTSPLFIITTYASCFKLIDTQFDLKIGDECHHLSGFNKSDKGYTMFHSITSNKSLYMTATKKIIESNLNNYSMDDERIFGKCIDEKTVKWAIDNGVIADYKVVVIKTTEDTIYDIISELGIELEDKHIELFISAYMTLKSLDTYHDLTHMLCYTNTIIHAHLVNRFIELLLYKNIFKSLHKEDFYNEALHSDSKCELDLEVNKMKNKPYGIISCVYIFGEGFNLPKLNGVCFVENMVSIIRIIQCALRASRKDSNHPAKIAYLLVPCIDNDNFNEESNSHKKIRSIVSNLGNEDENIDQRLIVTRLYNSTSSTKTTSTQHNHYELVTKDLELRRMRLRLRRSKDLKSKMSEEEEEYLYHKAVLQHLNSKLEYDVFKYDDKIKDIELYFKHKGVWTDKGWYDLLSIDTSNYPSTKYKWKQLCKEKNILSLDEYKRISKRIGSDLPEEPDKLYKDWNSSIEVELGITTMRRC